MSVVDLSDKLQLKARADLFTPTADFLSATKNLKPVSSGAGSFVLSGSASALRNTVSQKTELGKTSFTTSLTIAAGVVLVGLGIKYSLKKIRNISWLSNTVEKKTVPLIGRALGFLKSLKPFSSQMSQGELEKRLVKALPGMSKGLRLDLEMVAREKTSRPVLANSESVIVTLKRLNKISENTLPAFTDSLVEKTKRA